MQRFREYINEAGIQHLEHLADKTLDDKDSAHHALHTLKSIVAGSHPVSGKIDDKMSIHIKKHGTKVGVKYKGPGAEYNYSHDDIDKQHGHKPYVANPLHHVLTHVHKVLPHKNAEYQGGYMSAPHERESKNGHISHTPNTVKYSAPESSAEGRKLKHSKVSLTIHSELKGPDKEAHPISHKVFKSHPDVHIVPHDVDHHEDNISDDDKTKIYQHIKAAEVHMRGHTYDHHVGHSATMRSYMHSTVDTGEKPSTDGYKKHLAKKHDIAIDSVKTDKSKNEKRAKKADDLAHVDKHKKHFDKTFEIHHHIQQAVNHTARALDKKSSGFDTSINNKPSGGEGYVAAGHKIVDREGFAKANRERSAMLRASRIKK